MANFKLATVAYGEGGGMEEGKRGQQICPACHTPPKSRVEILLLGQIFERYLGVSGCGVNRNYIRGVVQDRRTLLSRRDSMEKDHADV